MTKVEIIEAFTGFPDGTEASRTLYAIGMKLELPEEFVALIVGKGHARKLAGEKPAINPPARKPVNEGGEA